MLRGIRRRIVGASRARHADAALDDIIMDEPEACGDVEVLVDSHQIAFEDVRFAYEEKEVLHGVSFVAREGQVTALVGPSGSGKSTCAQLAARFWIPGGGRVTCGGRDHTTVMSADKKIRTLMAERRSTFNQVTELTSRIKQAAQSPA